MQEWKASEKEAQKMTRDGAISVNLVTGEATHISDRPPEQDYSSADETAGVLNRAADEAAGHVERRQTKKGAAQAARHLPGGGGGQGPPLPPVCSLQRRNGRRRS